MWPKVSRCHEGYSAGLRLPQFSAERLDAVPNKLVIGPWFRVTGFSQPCSSWVGWAEHGGAQERVSKYLLAVGVEEMFALN